MALDDCVIDLFCEITSGIEIICQYLYWLIDQAYLPKQLSKDEIFSKVLDLKEAGITNIGQIMKKFASLPVDRKIVSEAIKEIIG